MQAALYAVSEKSEELTGAIRMSVPTISGELLLSERGGICALHPNLKVEMRLENRFVDLVEEGIDLAIRTGTMPDSEPDCPADLRFPLGDRLLAGLSGKPPEPRSAEDLLGHNCLTYTYQESGTANWLMKRPDATKSTSCRLTATCRPTMRGRSAKR